jgi:hypothetical protein
MRSLIRACSFREVSPLCADLLEGPKLKLISSTLPGTACNPSSQNFTPYPRYPPPTDRSPNCLHPPPRFRVPSPCQSPNHRQNGSDLLRRRGYRSASGRKRCGMRRGRSGLRDGDGMGRIRRKRSSGLQKFLLTLARSPFPVPFSKV